MIPILYETNEVAFSSNGIGRLRDCISCIVTEERNGIYECDFEYPIDGANYELIQIGRIVGVTHDDTGDVQPFDIVSYTKPIDGVVTFHCVHISYRQSYITTCPGAGVIGTTSDAIYWFTNPHTTPSTPFSYNFPIKLGWVGAADGLPHTVRQMLGGMEGSVLDTYGGEYEWDKFNVILHEARGQLRDFTIRYGVNMLEYQDETDIQGNYASCIPYWANGEIIKIGNVTNANGTTTTGRDECVPLDLTDKFENEPTTAQLTSAAKSYMSANNTYLPAQTINVSFVRLQDMEEYAGYQNLLHCGLCDTINVIFPDYQTQSQFKIVKTVWNVLTGRYDEMELGSLSTSLSEALGLTNNAEKTSDTFNNLSVLNDLTVTNDVAIGGDLGLNGQITDFYEIVVLSVETTASIAAHSYQSNATYTVPSGSRPSGMTLVGVVGWGASNFRLYAASAFVNGAHSISVTIANSSATSVAAGATINFRLLYAKATAAS